MYHIQELVVTNSAVLWYNLVRRWGECYKSVTDASGGGVPRQARYHSRRDTSAGEGAPRVGGRTSWAYIGTGELEAGSHELGAGSWIDKLGAEKGENIMWLVGGGFMFSGLLIGALSGSIALCLGVVGFGAVLMGCQYAQEQYKERQSQAWRKNYPSYRY